MNTYEEYKESEIEWIGKIPKHWKLKRIKDIAKIETGNTPSKKEVDNYGDEYLWVKPDELNNLIPITDSKEKLSEKGKNISRVVPKGSILVCCIGTIGKIGVAGKELSTNQQINTIIPNNLESSNYLKYLFIDLEEEEKRISNKVVVSILNKTKQGLIKIPYQNSDEQIKIADYLDDKTFKINKIIKNKKKQIDILLEKLKIKIKDILNKGLTETDTFNCEIKWIESYPKHWKIKKIQNTTYVKGRIGWQGLTSEEYLDSGEYYLITGTDFKEGKINWDSCHYIEKERYDEDPYIQLKEEDVLITKDGTIGKIAYVTNIPKPTTLNTGVFVTRPLNKKYLQRYMFWILNSHLFDSYIEYIKSGSTISHLYQNKFVRFYFPIPPKEEQEQIVNYLDTYSSNIQKAIKVIQTEIDKLEEYKKILIHDVVTGKMRVTI